MQKWGFGLTPNLYQGDLFFEQLKSKLKLKPKPELYYNYIFALIVFNR